MLARRVVGGRWAGNRTEESPDTLGLHAARKRGGGGCKSAVTESVAENIPPGSPGKVEMAG